MPPGEAQDILAAFRDHPLEPIVALALWTGLRQGEILGLRWRDVDVERRTITVAGSLQRLGGEWRLLPPKTRRSARTIAMPAPLAPVLAAHRDRQNQQRLRLGLAWHEEIPDLVFTTVIGTPLTGTTVTNRFQWTLKSKDLPVRRFHDLRHGCATLLLAVASTSRRSQQSSDTARSRSRPTRMPVSSTRSMRMRLTASRASLRQRPREHCRDHRRTAPLARPKPLPEDTWSTDVQCSSIQWQSPSRGTLTARPTLITGISPDRSNAYVRVRPS